jgi:16S rRNA (adenine1518-N6/adenine1519-N6)-dimethyltransferase
MTRPARRRWGQHFLHDPGVIERIVRAIDPRPDDHFVEIGPGRGALTAKLCEVAARVDAIEIDPLLAHDLYDQLHQPAALHVHQADALKFDFSSLQQAGKRLRFAGNLPYNISTPLLFRMLAQADCFSDAHVMLQKEVVTRMCADPGTRDYGRLTVNLAARSHVERLFTVRPGAFTPPPKVDSAVARLRICDFAGPRPDSYESLNELVRIAFSMRRKRLGNAAAALLSRSEIESHGIDPARRPETLSVEEYIRLANYLAVRSA